jgi:ribosomal RNA-processing protein 1
MCDRPLPQQSLAQALADLVHVLPDQEMKVRWLDAFWTTMCREWTSIDVLRMEKFLLLTRRYLGAGWQVCERAGWEDEITTEVLRVLGQGPMEKEDQRIPNGARYHVIDIYVDELERVGVLGSQEEEVKDVDVVEKLLEPLRTLAKENPTKTVRKKAKEALADERLPGNKKTEEQIAAEAAAKKKAKEDEGWGGFDD